MDNKSLSEFLNSTFEGDKEVSFVQKSLVGANLNYKSGVHCTPNLSVKRFKTKFDGRRNIVIPEGIRRDYLEKGKSLPQDIMYETKPFETAEESSHVRGIMNS